MSLPFRANAPGKLPSGSNPVVGGVKLPAGKPIVPDLTPGAASPVAWITLEPPAELGALHAALAAGFAGHGLWPLVLDSLDGDGQRPWLAGELDPSLSSSPDEHDAEAVVSGRWAEVNEGEPFPGMAAASTGSGNPEVHAAVVEHLGEQPGARLGLVAVRRPADALAALGWTGPTNHYSDMGPLSSVLRSWEERFGAVLVGVGFDTLTLAVARPPRDLGAATALAAEHYAMCPDNIDQGPGTVEEYADQLVGSPTWVFWWD